MPMKVVGNVHHVCFFFNNSLEFDTQSTLVVQQKSNPQVQANSSELLGTNCVSGKELGGTYDFVYKTNKRTRSGEFNISGNYPIVYLELSSNFIEGGPFELSITER